MERSESRIDLPGFRFHPTEEELLDFYLRQMVHGRKLNFDIIGTLNIYLHEPWELPGMAKIGEREWFFFVPRDRRSRNGGRPNRTTECGFWKATGSDRPIRRAAEPRRVLGVKKTMVFYRGRAPRGAKTDWVMNEYRLPESSTGTAGDIIPVKGNVVLCKVYRKATSLKELEQRAKMVDEKASPARISLTTTENTSNSDRENMLLRSPLAAFHNLDAKETKEEAEAAEDSEATSPSSSLLPLTSVVRPVALSELQVPKMDLEWLQDPFLTQLRSPWMDLWSPNFANILNY